MKILNFYTVHVKYCYELAFVKSFEVFDEVIVNKLGFTEINTSGCAYIYLKCKDSWRVWRCNFFWIDDLVI